MIAACGPSREIGIRGRNVLPWRIPSEFNHFLATTLNKAIVVGRLTFESMMQHDPIPGHQFRRIYVLTSQSAAELGASSTFWKCILSADSSNKNSDNVQLVRSLSQVVSQNEGDVWICGGESVYREAIESGLVSELLLTKIASYDPLYPSETDFVFFPLDAAEKHLKKAEVVREVSSEHYTIWSFKP